MLIAKKVWSESYEGDGCRLAAGLVELNPSQLEAAHIKAILQNDVLCVRVRDFVSRKQCAANASAIERDKRRTAYAGAEGIGCIGMSIYDIPFVKDGDQKYWNQVRAVHEQNRKACAPYTYPADLIRLRLSELWPASCDLFKTNGRVAFAGLPRFVSVEGAIEPHQDKMGDDIPHILDAHNVVGQCAANVFLKTAEIGGDLELYNARFSFAEYEARRVKGSYSLDRCHLGSPVLRVKPEVGDLILFDATRVHSVAAVAGRCTRVTVSCFVGLTRDGRLVIWS